MKKEGATMKFFNERIENLMNVYDSYISACKHIDMAEVYNAIVNMPATQFWISDERAEVVVAAIMKGKDCLNEMRPLKREMFEEIYRRVVELKEKYPTMNLQELCALAVKQPAPKFYLTPGSAKIMICKAKKAWYKKKFDRLKNKR